MKSIKTNTIRMKTIFQMTAFLLLTTLVACTSGSHNSYTISATGMEEYEDCNFLMIQLNKKSFEGYDTIVSTQIKEGHFLVKGQVEDPRKVYFSIDKNKKIKVKGDFILEKGELILKKTGQGYFTEFYVENGHYNTLVTNSWLLNFEYKLLFDNFVKFVANLTDEDYAKEEINKEYFSYKEQMKKIKEKISLDLAQKHEDPFVRLFAMSNSGLSIDEGEKILIELEAYPDVASSYTFIAKKEGYQVAKERMAMASDLEIGKQIKNFSAADIDGNKYSLNQVLEKNKFVLVEFWASWCGPCRNEIPHMKEAYENYHAKGFEIVSFSLDNKRKQWSKASEVEKIPWVNVSDLQGYNSSIVKMYGIHGVPANFLVSSSGKIIALDLRGSKLDEKLGELLSL